MKPKEILFFEEVLLTWSSGGWLMLPLLALTFYLYYHALLLWLQLEFHFLIQSGIHKMSDREISSKLEEGSTQLRRLLWYQGAGVEGVKRHFGKIASEYLPPVNRGIRMLSILITIGPLIGLLGTVTGMLSTFDGMQDSHGGTFQRIIHGISEALITTQTGLLISIPAMGILSVIIERKNRLRRCIARLERFNTCQMLKLGCPITAQIRQSGNNLPNSRTAVGPIQ